MCRHWPILYSAYSSAREGIRTIKSPLLSQTQSPMIRKLKSLQARQHQPHLNRPHRVHKLLLQAVPPSWRQAYLELLPRQLHQLLATPWRAVQPLALRQLRPLLRLLLQVKRSTTYCQSTTQAAHFWIPLRAGSWKRQTKLHFGSLGSIRLVISGFGLKLSTAHRQRFTQATLHYAISILT